MVTEADIMNNITESKDVPDNATAHSQVIRPKAGGDVRSSENVLVDRLSGTKLYTPPSNLVLTPAPECRKLARGISRATDNEGLVWALRNGTEDYECATLSNDHIFLLPDLAVYPTDFRTFIERDLLETAALITLESCGRLNWWVGRIPGVARLLPLATSGDGNCLPHAASLAAWGFHDRLLALRTRVQAVLSGEAGAELADALRRRWRWWESHQLSAAGLSMSESEWACEWAGTVSAARPTSTGRLHALDSLHVLALAHVMKRPIVVFADTLLRDYQGVPISPIPFGGIYLPIELDPSVCSKAPVLLAYDAGHFSALVPSEPWPSYGGVIPLEDASGTPLPIRFLVDPGNDFKWTEPLDQVTFNRLLPDEYQKISVLEAYLNMEKVECAPPEKMNPELRRSFDVLSSKSDKAKSVVKGFGSIGRSFSNKLKKNFGSVAKLSTKTLDDKEEVQLRMSEVLCCRVLAGRAPVQDEMVQNYLDDAWQRFTDSRSDVQPPRYGTGKSKFYTEADNASHESVRRSMSRESVNGAKDRTLYLSKSTFYDDRPPSPQSCKTPLCLYYGSPENGQYCSSCAKRQ